jgi:hypothetical protein
VNKVCTRCGVDKPLSEYGRQSANKDGLYYHCKECVSAYHKARYNDPKYKDYQRNSSLQATFGISLEKYNLMLDEQGRACAICGREEFRIHPKTGETKALSVDHCHSTGQIRGLLCSDCNFLLGNAKDSISTLASAIQYLSRWEVTE